MKIVYNKNDGSEAIAYEDPKNPNRIALPAGSIDLEPPSFNKETQTCSFDGTNWVVEEIPVADSAPTPDPISAMGILRRQRERLLATSDWRDLPSYPKSDQEAWRTYRQQLRDLPANSSPSLNENGVLTNVTWPTPPSE